jgi:hypothetical protein
MEKSASICLTHSLRIHKSASHLQGATHLAIKKFNPKNRAISRHFQVQVGGCENGHPQDGKDSPWRIWGTGMIMAA